MKWSRSPVLVSCLGLVLAACASAASPEASPPSITQGPSPTTEALGPPEVLDIRASIIAAAPLTAPWLAEQSGYFEDEGFNSVEFITGGSGPELISLLQAGQIEFTHSPFASGMQAVTEGFDLVSVSVSDWSTDGTEYQGRRDVMGLLVQSDSDIDDITDFEGRTLGVSSVLGIHWVFAVQDVLMNGGDPSLINFVELPIPNALDAVLAGTVDGAIVLEPFLTVGLDAGNVRAVAWPYVDVSEGAEVPLGGYHTTREFAEQNPITVQRFVHAIQRAMDDMTRDQEYAREKIVEFTGMDPALASKIWVPPLNTQADPEAVRRQMTLMIELELLEAPIDLDEYLWSTHFERCDGCFHDPNSPEEYLERRAGRPGESPD